MLWRIRPATESFFACMPSSTSVPPRACGEVRIVVVRRIFLRFFERDDLEAFLIEDPEQIRQDVRAERAQVQQHHVVDVASENSA